MSAVVGACGDDSNAGADAPLPDAADCAPGTVARTGNAYKYGSMGGGAFNGVKLCVEGRPELCDIATQGFFDLCVPETDYGLRATFSPYETAVFLFDGGAPSPLTTETGDVTFVTTLWADTPATFPPTTNSLIYMRITNSPTTGLADATVSISPQAGTITYGDINQVADSSLTATTGPGTLYIGDLPPGMYDVTVTSATAAKCKNVNGPINLGAEYYGGWESPVADAEVRVPTYAGVTTAVTLHCEP